MLLPPPTPGRPACRLTPPPAPNCAPNLPAFARASTPPSPPPQVRARLSSMLADLCPGDVNGFLFPSSGGEANEAAIRMARRFTGRHKVCTPPNSPGVPIFLSAFNRGFRGFELGAL